MARIKFTTNLRALQRDLKKVQRQLTAIKKQGRRAANDAMSEEANRILSRSKKLVPVKSGRLRDSGKVKTDKTGSGVEHEVVFDAPYAFSVHERTDIKHPRGRAKYLEIAAKEQARGLAKRVAAQVSQALKRILK